jgi:hypothetical protein
MDPEKDRRGMAVQIGDKMATGGEQQGLKELPIDQFVKWVGRDGGGVEAKI